MTFERVFTFSMLESWYEKEKRERESTNDINQIVSHMREAKRGRVFDGSLYQWEDDEALSDS